MTATASPEDRPDWLRLYLEEYWTLEQVGELLGITREAVRQRLKARGIKSRSSTETALLRERREISLRGDEIRAAFLRTRDVTETARLVGLSEALVQRALDELVPDFRVLTRVPRDPSKKYNALERAVRSHAYREASRLNPDFALDLTIAEEWLEFISASSTRSHQGSASDRQADADLPG